MVHSFPTHASAAYASAIMALELEAILLFHSFVSKWVEKAKFRFALRR
jgi:hypothetical protein